MCRPADFSPSVGFALLQSGLEDEPASGGTPGPEITTAPNPSCWCSVFFPPPTTSHHMAYPSLACGDHRGNGVWVELVGGAASGWSPVGGALWVDSSVHTLLLRWWACLPSCGSTWLRSICTSLPSFRNPCTPSSEDLIDERVPFVVFRYVPHSYSALLR